MVWANHSEKSQKGLFFPFFFPSRSEIWVENVKKKKKKRRIRDRQLRQEGGGNNPSRT